MTLRIPPIDALAEMRGRIKMGCQCFDCLVMQGAVKQIEDLQAALKPFAAEAASFDDIPGVYHCHDNVEVWQKGNYRCPISVGDLRKARELTGGACEQQLPEAQK